MHKIILIGYLLLSGLALSAQTITGNTGYAVPPEKDEEEMFTSKGVEHWANTKQRIEYYFYLRNTGLLDISINIKNSISGSKLKAIVAGKEFIISVPKNEKFQLKKIGSVNINKSGFYFG